VLPDMPPASSRNCAAAAAAIRSEPSPIRQIERCRMLRRHSDRIPAAEAFYNGLRLPKT